MLSLYRLLLKVLSPAMKLRFVALIIFTTLVALIEAIVIGSVIPFMQIIRDPMMVFQNQYGNSLCLFWGLTSTQEIVLFAGVGVIMLFILKNILSILQLKMMYSYIHNFYSILANKLLASYLSKPYAFYLKSNTSILTKNVTTETMNIAVQMLDPVLNIFSEFVVLICVGLVLFLYDSTIAIVSVLIAVIIISAIYFFASASSRRLGKEREYTSGQIAKLAYEAFSGIREIKVAGIEQFFISAFSKHTKNSAKATSTHNTIQMMPKIFLESIIVTGIIGGILYFTLEGSDSKYMVNTMVLYLAAAYRVMPSINRISSAFMRLHFAKAGLDVIKKDLEPSLVLDSVNQKKLDFQNEISLKEVSYRYSDISEYVLDFIEITINKGDILALIGESGAGKSTLLNLLTGLLEPTCGWLAVDGNRVDNLNVKNWQSAIAYVPQSVFVADDSLLNNIALGIKPEEIDIDKINRIVDTVQLREFVNEKKEGLETILGDRGNRLSGGQVQRIGLARALYRECSIVILDEALSALDMETEKKVLVEIKATYPDLTLLIVTHRQSTLAFCNYIYEVRGGKVISRKTESVLLSYEETQDE